MRLHTAAVAPMPSASVSTATAVKPGFFTNWRMANLRSFIAQCLHRIDLRRAAGGDVTGQQRHSREKYRHACEREWISRFDAEKKCSLNLPKGEGDADAYGKPRCD